MSSPARKPQGLWAALAEPQTVIVLLILYCAVHFLVRFLLSPNFTLDESEQVLFGQSLQWGYRFRHPPLITWLSWATLDATNNSRAAFFLLKYALMTLGLVAYFAAARTILRDVRLAALATFALLTTFVMGWLPHVDLMHTVLLATMLAAYLWADARTLTRGTLGDYLVLGVVTGLGVLSKYVFIVLPLSMAIGVAMTPRFRRRLRIGPLLLAAVAAAIIVAPYAIWAATHEYSLFALAKTITKSAGPSFDPVGWLKGAGDLVVALIGFGIPFIAIFPLFYWRACWPLHAGDEDERAWLRTLEITMIAAALMMLGAVFFIGTEAFKPRWMHQVLMPLPIYLFLRVKLAYGAEARVHKLFALVALAFALIAVAARIWIYETEAEHCKICREYWPMPRYADTFRRAGFVRGTVVAPSYDLAGNLRAQFPESRVVTPGYPVSIFGPPVKGECLLVWRGDGDVPRSVRDTVTATYGARLENRAVQGDVEAMLLTSKRRRERMNFMILPEGSCDHPRARP